MENRRGFVRIVLSCPCHMLFLCVVSLAALSTPNYIDMEAGDAGHTMDETEELNSFYRTIRQVCLQYFSALVGYLKIIARRLAAFLTSQETYHILTMDFYCHKCCLIFPVEVLSKSQDQFTTLNPQN